MSDIIERRLSAEMLAKIFNEIEKDGRDLLERRDWQSVEEVEQCIKEILENVGFLRDIMFS